MLVSPLLPYVVGAAAFDLDQPPQTSFGGGFSELGVFPRDQ